MTAVDLTALLDDVDKHVADELERMPRVEPVGDDFDIDHIPGGDDERLWQRLSEAVAVVADLKSSTQLGLRQKAPSTASIYEASTGNVATIFHAFESDFMVMSPVVV